MMIKYTACPDEAHKEFEKLVKEVSSCVSAEDLDKSTLLRVKNEWLEYNSNLLSTTMSSMIEKLWTSIDLENKLKNLNELEKENVGPAWRPETGQCTVLSIKKGNHLRKLKKSMEKHSVKLTKKSTDLQDEIKTLRKEITVQQDELIKYEFCGT